MIDITSNPNKSEMTISNNGTIEAKVKDARISPGDLITLLRQVPANCDVTSVYILTALNDMTDIDEDARTTVTIKYSGTRNSNPASEPTVKNPRTIDPLFGRLGGIYCDQHEKNPLEETMRAKEILV